MPTFTPKTVRTIVLTEDSDGRRNAFVVPQGPVPVVKHDADDEINYGHGFGARPFLSPRIFNPGRKTLEIELKEYKMLTGDGPEGMHGPMDEVLGKAMAVVDDHLAQLEAEAKQKQRLAKAIAALEGEGVGPKKARRLAEAALYAAGRVK